MMKKLLTKKLFFMVLFLLILGGGLLYFKIAQGVNRTWDGGGVDGTCGGAGTANNWSCAANWSADTVPTASDVAIFDGTSTKNATINANISVAGISINSGYTGTITQGGSNTVTVGSSYFIQAAGTFTGGSGAITVNGTFTLSSGTFTSTSGTLQVGRPSGSGTETFFTVSGGTFNHNNGTVSFNENCAGCGSAYTYTVDVVSTLTLYNIVANTYVPNGTGYLTTASGDTITATNDFTQTDGQLLGTWEVQGNVIIGSGADGGVGTLTYTTAGAHTYAYTAGGIGPNLRVNHASATVSAAFGTTDLGVSAFSLLAGTFTAPTGIMAVGRLLSLASETFFTVSGGTFNHNNGTVSLIDSCTPGCGITNTYTIDVVSSLTLYNIIINSSHTSGAPQIITTASGDTIIAANNFTHTSGRLNGTWEVQGNYTVATTADGGTAGITFTGGNAQTYTDNGGDEVDGDVTVNKSAGTVTLASGADWNATNQDLTITAGTLSQSTYNLTTTNFTVNGGTFTGGSGSVTIGSLFSLSSGTFTAPSGSLILTFSAVCGSDTTVFTVSGGTYNHNNGTTSFTACTGSGQWYKTYTLDVVTSLTFYNVVVDISPASNYSTLSAATGDTIIVANNFTQTNGDLDGTWEVQGNVIIGSGADGGVGTLTMTGTGSKTYTYSSGGIGPYLKVNNASLSVSAAGGTTNLSVTMFSLLAGTFTAPTGTFTIGLLAIGGSPTGCLGGSDRTIFTVSGGVYNHNNGTTSFSCAGSGNWYLTFTVDVSTSLTLYNVIVDMQPNSNYDYLATGSGDTIIVANNFTHTNGKLTGTWEVQGNYTVATTADGGTATTTFTGGNNQTYTDQGGDEVDGDIAINKALGSSVTLASNADWNAGSQDVTVTSGELNMGASYNLSTTALTIASDGHLSNNGTGGLTLAGNVSNSGSISLRANGTCGGADDILIRSSVGGTQRTWSGSGVFLFHDVNVQDQGGSATITAYSSTSVSGNGGNWTFSGAACLAQPPTAGLSTGKINMQSGKFNLR